MLTTTTLTWMGAAGDIGEARAADAANDIGNAQTTALKTANCVITDNSFRMLKHYSIGGRQS
jgi:hypothetical protein